MRQHPEWRVNKHIDGVTAVTTGKSVYIEVNIYIFFSGKSFVLKILFLYEFKGKGFLEHLMERDYLESNQCRLSTTKEEFFKSKFAFIAAKGSPLASVFNRK